MISYFSPLINLSLTTCSHDEEDGHDDGLSSRGVGHLVPGPLWGALQTRQVWEGEYGSSTQGWRNNAGVKY